jgi:hypothetical protein
MNTFVIHDPMRPRTSARYSQTREQLREMARKHNVKRGRNTDDTVRNLRAAGLSI